MEHSTPEWHQVNVKATRNGKSICPFCMKILRDERAV
ncbi:Histone H3 [Giardia duodenalis]|uniref:Histone H3 n=1 Tax=Giardia intestinalis TaxID=5741 RepID=V6TBW9_GIAIN|nr:Histone H3 [Giardia intestinalis]